MKCLMCGEEFTQNSWNQVYCSIECVKMAKNKRRKKPIIEKECIFCGEIFQAKRADAFSCGKRDVLHRPNEKIKRVKVICDCCGEYFEQTVSTHNRNKRENRKNYCSQKCMGEAYKDRVEITCSECGKTFQRAKSGYDPNNKHYFCSKECQKKNTDYILSGEEHYNYINGDTSYIRGVGWSKARKETRKRDNYTCQHCGITEEQLGKQLDVHHIKPYRLFDNSKEANELTNLISLCPSCHHKQEAKLHKEDYNG